MREGLALVGLVDHGGQHHQAVEPDIFGVAGEAAGERGSVLGHAGQHGNAPAHRLFHLAQEGELLLIFEGGILAHGAEEDHAVDARGDHGFQVPGGAFQVRGTGPGETAW